MNKKEISKTDREKFRRKVWAYYKKHGRHHLPWRKTHNPYCILVSEVMLQQTQVDRVLQKYLAFIERFPNVETLARAPLSDVLIVWQGLGYNRRAKMLHDASKYIVREHAGTVPREYDALKGLPGIGDYTARAVRAFAFNEREVLIETNIRAVYIEHFFNTGEKVHDTEILSHVSQTLPRGGSREWYGALMDYGSYLKKTQPNPSRTSATYKKQKPFKGSRREVRGALIRALTSGRKNRTILSALPFDIAVITEEITSLQREGLIACTDRSCALSK